MAGKFVQAAIFLRGVHDQPLLPLLEASGLMQGAACIRKTTYFQGVQRGQQLVSVQAETYRASVEVGATRARQGTVEKSRLQSLKKNLSTGESQRDAGHLAAKHQVIVHTYACSVVCSELPSMHAISTRTKALFCKNHSHHVRPRFAARGRRLKNMFAACDSSLKL